MERDRADEAPGPRPAQGRWLLVAGAAIGIALAGAGIVDRPEAGPLLGPRSVTAAPEPLPADAVARVNDRLITRAEYESVLALDVAAGAVRDAEVEQRILDRMIDEELRVQRAIELDLHLTDPRVRMDLAAAVAEATIAAADQEPPDEVQLRSHFDRKREYFARRGPLRVRQIWVATVAGNVGDAFARARHATRLLREKQAFEVVKRTTGDAEPQPLPERFLTPEELAGLLDGPSLNAALTLEPGEVSEPIRTFAGFRVLVLRERRAHRTASFDACRRDVEANYWAERTRQAMEASAAELRKRARLQQSTLGS